MGKQLNPNLNETAQSQYAATYLDTCEMLETLLRDLTEVKAPEFATYGDFADLNYLHERVRDTYNRRFGIKEAS